MTRPSLTVLSLATLSTLLLSACASDFAPDRDRPAPTRAVQSPVETNSEEAEVLAPSAPAVPLVTVDSSGARGDHPTIRTIYDNVHDTLNPPPGTPTGATIGEPAAPPPTATIIVPTTQPATAIPHPVDPVTGE